ncbi:MULTISPECIES: discoidin domain-containing protein [Niastella]|uniref:Discoidin domain-containing protein n=1 Tax=Niastella soli TaxID=2821487 RepID=A0ABS3YT79_9BACT|nr:discoidin domain-containing protein [Niastella soli]MBO9201069.1 discoidin domain-containing protein [Niastella soli]
MKHVYAEVGRTLCLTAILLISSMTMNPTNAQTPADQSSAGYVPAYTGKVIPNEFIDFRQNTRLVYEGNNAMTALPNPVEMRDLIITASQNDGIVLQWRSTWEPDNLKLYEIEFSSDGINFQRVGVLAAGNYLSGKNYSFRHYPVNIRDQLFYRIRITDATGRYDYTPILKLAATGSTQNYVFPTIVNTEMVSLYLNDSFKMAQIINSQGVILQTQLLSGKTGRTDISLSHLAEGICYVRLLGNDPQRNVVEKIFIR